MGIVSLRLARKGAHSTSPCIRVEDRTDGELGNLLLKDSLGVVVL